jgi:hypothetical protein
MPSITYAGDPQKCCGDAPSDKGVVLPVTPAMQVALERKMLAFQAVATAVSSASVSGQMPASLPSSYVLSTYPRHQHRWFYCGPATVQVVSNYTWDYYYSSTAGESSSTNKYLQSYISTHWTMTDRDGQTTLPNLINGMNTASVLPFSGFYQQWHNPVWSDFQYAIATDTSTWFMPLAANVNPRPTGSNYYLYSWRNVSPGSYGHDIPLHGYSGFTQSTAIAYYDDSSGGRDEVTGVGIAGSLGAFTDLSFTVYETMMLHYGNLVW